MAGNYPDVPSWRMAYDRDGTAGIRFNGSFGAVASLTPTEMANLNLDTVTNVPVVTSNQWLALVFPEDRDIDAVFAQKANSGSVVQVQTSPDTTNGIDGTWTNLIADYPDIASPLITDRRTAIQSGTVLAVRGIRFWITGGGGDGLGRVQLFGEISPGENPNRLSIVKAALDERIDPAYLDWGNVPRSSTADKTFRIKNLSSTLTAHSIRVALEALSDTAPSVSAQHVLSFGGGSFLAQVNIGDLAPGAISGVVTIRRVTPSDAALGLWWLRTFAEADSWS